MFGFWDVVLVRKLPKFSANYKQFSFEEMIFSSSAIIELKNYYHVSVAGNNSHK
jgi:hypothetical protein